MPCCESCPDGKSCKTGMHGLGFGETPLFGTVSDSAVFDYWTVVHLAVGAIVGAAIPNRRLAYPLMIGFELLENRFWPGWRESRANVISDMVVDIVAYEIGRGVVYGKVKKPRPVIRFTEKI